MDRAERFVDGGLVDARLEVVPFTDHRRDRVGERRVDPGSDGSADGRSPPGGAVPCRLLRLQALAGGSPAEDGVSGDARVLSIAVTRVVFDYAG